MDVELYLRRRKLNVKNARNRRLRMIAAREKGHHTKAEWEEMKAFFDDRCVRCGIPSCWIEKDHIIPIYQGGSDSIKNLQPLCHTCNRQKGPEDIDWRQSFCNDNRLEMPSTWQEKEVSNGT